MDGLWFRLPLGSFFCFLLLLEWTCKGWSFPTGSTSKIPQEQQHSLFGPATTTIAKTPATQRLSSGYSSVVPSFESSLPLSFATTSQRRRQRRQGYPYPPTTLQMVAATTASCTADVDALPTETTAATTSSKIPNWRVVADNSSDSKSEEQIRQFLSERATWSERQFQASLDLYNQFTSCTDSYVAPQIQQALNILDHAFRLYGPESVICSFNGGKDAVVILNLVRAAHAKYFNDARHNDNDNDNDNNKRKSNIIRPRVIYFDLEDEFPEVRTFLNDTVHMYDLEMIAFEQGVKFSEGLEILVRHNVVPSSSSSSSSECAVVSMNDQSFPMAFVLGTRKSDPNAKGQDHFAPSSHYMPPFMRVNPILDWTYGHVWHFLRLFHLPYCCLYDQGYTSLGTTKDTYPCPALAVLRGKDADSTTNLPKFWPAYMLSDWHQERAGRIKKEKKASGNPKTTAASSSATEVETAPETTTTTTESNPAYHKAMSCISDLKRSDSQNNINNQDEEIRSVSSIGARSLTLATDTKEEDETGDSQSSVGTGDFTMTNTSDGDGHECTNQKNVGILIIGDEILKGLTVDVNTNAAAKALRKESVLLSRVVVVSDNPEQIVKEIKRMQDEVDVIITSGGVGPTHDDVTIKSVATALNRDMVFHEEMAALLREKMKPTPPTTAKDESENEHKEEKDKPELTEAQIKMATLPSDSKLRYLSPSPKDWPVLQCRNIFILPGVPQFFAPKIEAVAEYLSTQLERSDAYKVVLSVDEAAIVSVLNAAVEKHPNVSFGSYPFVSHPEFKTVLTLEEASPQKRTRKQVKGELKEKEQLHSSSTNPVMTKEQRDRYVRLALDDLITQLPEGSILRVDNDDLTPLT